MEALEREARSAGVPGIGLDTGTDEGFAPARSLYERLGYAQVSGPFIASARMPADADIAVFIEVLTVWVKRF
jgi:hypothetical protein